MVGKKSAILVGCKYEESEEEMYGCGNDVQTMRKLLMECFYFKKENITMMIENEPLDPNNLEPTETNIKQQIEKMIRKAERGDILFFFFSGLGKLVDNSPVIVSCDMENITAKYFGDQVKNLREEVSFTFVCDSSHSGGLIDGEKEQFPQQGSPGKENNGILFSACKADETAARTFLGGNKLLTYGAFTSAFDKQVRNHHPISNRELVKRAAVYLQSENYSQQPCLYCTDKNVDKHFLACPKAMPL